jgi:hypothetical protein
MAEPVKPRLTSQAQARLEPRPPPPQGPSIAIHHCDAVVEAMNDWCKEHHGKSGLTQRVRESTVSLEEAEAQVGLGASGCKRAPPHA